MTFLKKNWFRSLLCVALLSPLNAFAVSIMLSPAVTTAAPGSTVDLDVLFDFSADPTIGGSVDFAFSGPIAFQSFAPSAAFLAADPSFSGFGQGFADTPNGFALFVGDFFGIGGTGTLGTITISTAMLTGVGNVDLAINSLFGPFLSATTFTEQTATLTGAQIIVSAVPLPAGIWLFFSALTLLGFSSQKTKRARISAAA